MLVLKSLSGVINMVHFKFEPVLQADSIIVVSGANGFIAGHICEQALAAGYRVRGTVRSLERTQWLLAFFNRRHKPARFSLVEVDDIFAEDAFDAAVKDASALIHIATDIKIPVEAEPYVSRVTQGTV